LCDQTECESSDPETFWFKQYTCSDDSVNWDGHTNTFQDPIPALIYEAIAMNVTLYANFGCNILTSPSVAVTVDSVLIEFLPVTQQSTKCNCSNCAFEILLQSTIYQDGWQNYTYGGFNTINIIKSPEVYICVSKADISIGYAYRIPTVSNWAPFGVPVNEIGQVEIIGTNFLPELNITCEFEGIASVPATIVVKEYVIVCEVPIQSEEKQVSLSIQGMNSTSPIPVGDFSWYTQPVPTSFTPTYGPIGGQDVYIIGTGFFNSSALICKFGFDLIPGTFLNSTMVLCTQVSHQLTPSLSVNVSISQNGRNFAQVPGQYVFLSVPTTTATPSSMPSPSESPAGNTAPAGGANVPGYVWAALSFLIIVVMALFLGVVVITLRNRQLQMRRNEYAAESGGSGSNGRFSKEFDSASKWINDPNAIPMHEIKNLVQIEKGSFGVIYEATWRGTKIAVKKLPANMSQKTLNEFYQEAALMRALRHPNILQYLGIAFSGTDICICMGFMEQGSLYRILHAENPTFSRSRIKSICLDTARGMTYLHEQHPPIIHRDLKSHNLLVDKHWQVKVCDFGLSRITEQNQTMTACGTPSWTAPEVLRNERYTTKADVYGFGIVIWEMFARNDPFPGMPPFQIVFAVGTQKLRPRLDPSWPKEWVDLITRCWNEDPDQRPTFQEILVLLEDMSPPSDE